MLPRRARGRDVPVSRQVLLLQVGLVGILVVVALALSVADARSDARGRATDRALAVAGTLADSPTVGEALASEDPSAVLQPYAEAVRADTGVDFITIMTPARLRLTHPDPAMIGLPFQGDVGTAPSGVPFTQEYAGTLGPSMRAVVPVLGDDGTLVAMVSVGITLDRIEAGVWHDVLRIAVVAALVLALGVAGAWWVGRRLRRQTHGLGADEITRMYEYYSAVLHAVREGLLLLDSEGRVRLANDEARRLLDLPTDVAGRRLVDCGLAPGLVAAALGDAVDTDDLYLAGDRLLVVSSAPARWQGRGVGAVVTLRDRTELQQVTGERDAVRGLVDSLRAQNHEAANRLHTVVSLVETGHADEAVDLATEELAVAQLLADRVSAAVGDPVAAALLLGKTAEAAERGVELTVVGTLEAVALPARDLVTVLGNLVDNAFEALGGTDRAEAADHPRRVEVELGQADDGAVRVRVADSGPGLAEGDAERVLERGWTTKAEPGTGRGLGLTLVAQVVRRHRGSIDIGPGPLGGAQVTVVLHPRATTVPETEEDA
ncbi:sensor histidine kinase [Nocardioides bruguierae]|uniref:sensor histidine kinase n=1 Tax=Nocardioides bruguierae TaxID=2945102 RepID=UPI002021F02B|nr:sensor histidine kinase [Nocardioides bruguierae]MCL8027338.1 sensor histidine kinase [Nocardioides bruguierae]